MDAARAGEAVDTLIIGCGMAGLAAGIRLAMYGKRVVILEKHNVPGGLNSFYFKDGRKFDVGLHAVTNFVEKGRGTPLGTLLRQLRLPWEAFKLSPQAGSRIAFPGVDLRFDNDFSTLQSEVARAFPNEVDAFLRLRERVLGYDALDLDTGFVSARAVVADLIHNPVLQDMLFCPLMYYGSASEQDMDFGQFVTLWRAIFEEGFARPFDGVRVIIRALLDRYRSLGGTRRMKCGVKRILVNRGTAHGVELESGEVLTARNIISTAGLAETRLLCHPELRSRDVADLTGKLSFGETISCLDTQPAALGCAETIIFFNDRERFNYAQAEDPFDLHSGVICFPNNYRYPDGECLAEGILRVTGIASYEKWMNYSEQAYRDNKEEWFPKIVSSASRFLPEISFEALQQHTVYRDMFTPRTITRFTSHLGGAVYGSPEKAKNGLTEFKRLYIAGTDQGFLGIVGAMLSGISIANKHVLMAGD
jgi:phytoene dehydrogenase-like protein